MYPIETAPKNESVFIYIPNAEHYGECWYRAILVDMGTGPHWSVSGLHMGRDLGPEHKPTHWVPMLPKPGEPQPYAIELVEYSYEKYGEHTLALKVSNANGTGGGNIPLLDTCSLFKKDNSLAEYHRVKGEAADLAKRMVAQMKVGAVYGG